MGVERVSARLHCPTCSIGLTFGYMWYGGGGVPTLVYMYVFYLHLNTFVYFVLHLNTFVYCCIPYATLPTLYYTDIHCGLVCGLSYWYHTVLHCVATHTLCDNPYL